ncbi:MAG: sulfatase-like hydrolase/transferase [Planctomycetota bacterium]|jgi:arylsulfatase A-like enzyme
MPDTAIRFAGVAIVAAVVACIARPTAAQDVPLPANVVIIVSDDAGYADFSMHGSDVMRTPRLDALAAAGVRFTQGYVSASVCSPSRAGLLTGRHQQRFGHEFNIPPRYSEENGLPVEEATLADLLSGAGYRSIALGKWHLGYAPHFHPLSRGFDDFHGFLQGSRSYRPIKGNRLNRLLRDRAPAPETFEYMTDELGHQAATYIEAHREKPFFLYLAYNAVHGPMHALEADLAAVDGVDKPRRRKLVAMTHALDRSIGTVLDALERTGVAERTLVIFINDNGGATNNASVNAPLRGTKGTPFEGGLRVPFVMRWPGHIPAGLVYQHPVSALDIVPTALAAAGVEAETTRPLDGVDLIPFLKAATTERPHQTLHWRRGPSWAIRDGDWKLLQPKDGSAPMLFDLAADEAETTNLAAEHPERVAALRSMHADWSRTLATPRWRPGSRKKAGPAQPDT